MRHVRNSYASHGFTFIELLISLVLMAIAFLPLMNMFSVSLGQTSYLDDLSSARYLVQEGMDKLKVAGNTRTQLVALGDQWDPVLTDPPRSFNGLYWRVKRALVLGDTDPLQIEIQVYRLSTVDSAIPDEPLVRAFTMMTDLDWIRVE